MAASSSSSSSSTQAHPLAPGGFGCFQCPQQPTQPQQSQQHRIRWGGALTERGGSPYAPAAASTATAEPAATALILPFYEGQSQVLSSVL